MCFPRNTFMYAFLSALEAEFSVMYFKMLLFIFSQINKYYDNEKSMNKW